KAHLCVTGLLVGPARAAIGVRDPVVDAVETEFVPRETSPQPHGLARDPATVEIVSADDDPALAIAADPVDAEDPGEADRLVLIRDGPLDLGAALGGVLKSLFLALVGELAKTRPPEPPDLGRDYPARSQLEMFTGRRDKGYAVPSHSLWAEHQ